MESLTYRRATRADVPNIVTLLSDDELGATRETPDNLEPYVRAFTMIERDENQHLIVIDRSGIIVGTLQISITPGLSRQGCTRATIESVRVSSSERGTGLGTEMFHWAINECRQLNADIIQLTSDVQRTDAHRFYEKLGFVPTHVGFKMQVHRD